MTAESQPDIERRLQRIESKLDRLINGNDGQEGIFDRLTKVEQRQGFLSYCYGWIVVGLIGIGSMVVPGYFSEHK